MFIKFNIYFLKALKIAVKTTEIMFKTILN